jgi:hypothetical protein
MAASRTKDDREQKRKMDAQEQVRTFGLIISFGTYNTLQKYCGQLILLLLYSLRSTSWAGV